MGFDRPKDRPLTRRLLLKLGSLAAAGVALAPRELLAAEPPGNAGLGPASNLTPGGPTPRVFRFALREKPIEIPGISGTGMLVNESLPGPEIRVREGELVRIIVRNELALPATVHWHGLLLPNAMDGVPNVTQEPIAPGGYFVYEYALRQSGTYWYHSHFEFEEQLGLHGPYIIEPKREPHAYDQELVLFVSDWLDGDPWQVIPAIRSRKLPPGIQTPGSAEHPLALPNGKPFEVDVGYRSYLMNGHSGVDPFTLGVKSGTRLRVRLINASTSSFFRFSIDAHPLTVIASDGQPVEPVTVDDVMLATAERYDFLVDVKSSGSFGIRAQALGQVGGAAGVLHTRDVPASLPERRAGWGPRSLRYSDLRAPEPTRPAPGPEKLFPLRLHGDMAKYVWMMGAEPLKTRFVPAGDAAPMRVAWGDRVTVEFENTSMMFHPMHLHGHFFRLLGATGDDARAPLKDTVGVAPGEKLRIQFLADNPGHWIFHCHNLYHLEAGMGRIVTYRT